MSDTTTTSPSGCGCFGTIVGILLLCALFVGVITPWGVFHIDFFPPAIRLEK